MGWSKNRMFEPSTIWAIWMGFSGSGEVLLEHKNNNKRWRLPQISASSAVSPYHQTNEKPINPYGVPKGCVFLGAGSRSSSLWFSIVTWTQPNSRLPLPLGPRSLQEPHKLMSKTNHHSNTNLTTIHLYPTGWLGFWTKMQSLSKTSSLTQDELHALSSSCRWKPGVMSVSFLKPEESKDRSKTSNSLRDATDQVIVSKLSNWPNFLN